jgi:hypothetical protein
VPSTYTPIATTRLTSDTNTVTFSSISGIYTDLVISAAPNGTRDTYGGDFNLRFNGDTAANYSQVQLVGTGASATTAKYYDINGINIGSVGGYGSYKYTTISWHVFNYSNTTTYKAVMATRGRDATLVGGQWNSNAAITSVTCFNDGGYNFVAGSVFSLFGIKAA